MTYRKGQTQLTADGKVVTKTERRQMTQLTADGEVVTRTEDDK